MRSPALTKWLCDVGLDLVVGHVWFLSSGFGYSRLHSKHSMHSVYQFKNAALYFGFPAIATGFPLSTDSMAALSMAKVFRLLRPLNGGSAPPRR